MSTPPLSPSLASDRDQADREKRFVAAISVVAAVALTGGKIVVGVATGSLGIISEALHSGLDLVAGVVTLWAVHKSGKPADREHTYGHGKFENLSALFETLLLLATCVWILYEVVSRLFLGKAHAVDPSPWAFGVMFVSIAVDYSRSRALSRVAKKYDSQALEADALHFSTDIWSSCVVILGLTLVLLGDKLGTPWLAKADAIAASAVAGIVVWVSLKLGKKSVDDLLDAVPPGIREKVDAAARVNGVLDVLQVRVRRSGPETFADVTVAVPRSVVLESAHAVASAAEESIKQAIPGTDVVVHVEPIALEEELPATVRLVASRFGLGAHAIDSFEKGGKLSLALHLEVDERMDLDAAHDLVSKFEQELRVALPVVERITSHIEPAERRVSLDGCPSAPESEQIVRSTIEATCRQMGVRLLAHDLQIHPVGESSAELAVSFSCAMEARASVGEAHQLSEEMETKLREKLPQVGRVTIHVEPLGEASTSDRKDLR